MPVLRDLPYRDPGAVPEGRRCLADLHLPAAEGPADALVWLHGGGLVEGDKAGGDGLIAPLLAARGWSVVTPTYRFLQHAPWPACIEDAAAATAWAPQALAAHGRPCRRLFLGGMSAGAYLAAMTALDRRWLAAHGHDPDRLLAGAIPLSGQMTSHFNYRPTIGHPADRPLIDHAAPLWHVRPDAPPLLLIAGDDDMPCRPEENRLMLAALRQVGHHRASCHIIPGRTHGTIAAGLGDPADAVARLILGFLGQGGA